MPLQAGASGRPSHRLQHERVQDRQQVKGRHHDDIDISIKQSVKLCSSWDQLCGTLLQYMTDRLRKRCTALNELTYAFAVQPMHGM